MCQSVPPLELYDDELYNLLPRTWQYAVARMCVRLHKHGDGALTDEWLMKKLFTAKKRLPEFRALIIGLGYFRDVDGSLHRAGLLAPSAPTEEEHAMDTWPSANAVRVRTERLVAREVDKMRLELGLPLLNESAQPVHKNGTEAAHPAKNVQSPSRASESDQILIRSDSLKESESDPIRSDAEHPTVLPKCAPFDKLLVEGTDKRVLAEAARRMAAHNPPIPFWKERYLRQTVKSILAEQQESLTMLSSEMGGAPSSPGPAPAPRSGTGLSAAFNTGAPPPIGDIRAMAGLSKSATGT